MTNIDFMGLRKYSYMIAIGILVLGVVFFLINGGFNLDVQFRGGTELQFEIDNDHPDTIKAEELISETLEKNVTVQESTNTKVDNTKVYSLVVRVSSSEILTNDETDKVKEIISNPENGFGFVDDSQVQINNIQPSIGQELMGNGILAGLFSLALIIVYIAFRFRQISGLSAGMISTFSMILDALIVLSFYAIFNIKLNESVIAAVLTTLSYSINDKVVVFDRMRENSLGRRKMPYDELVNISTNQTLTRSVNTAITSLISIVTVLIASLYFNIPSITNFAGPMTLGIVFSCLTSSFIAAPMFGKHKENQAVNKHKA